jgi:hypothetical protein
LRRSLAGDRVRRQWAALRYRPRAGCCGSGFRLGRDRRLCLYWRLLRLGTAVVVCNLDADLASILAAAGKLVPLVALAATRHNNVAQIDPLLSNQFRLLVVVEHRDLKLVVVGRVVDGESEFLVPAAVSLG